MTTRSKLYLLAALCILALIFVPGLTSICADLIVNCISYIGTKVSVNLR